jgi:hypothetical protein
MICQRDSLKEQVEALKLGRDTALRLAEVEHARAERLAALAVKMRACCEGGQPCVCYRETLLASEVLK